MKQRTELLGTTQRELEHAGTLLRDGRLVVFPTETVYGLGADAGNPRAVSSIFAAKGRPADNPLIVHLSSLSELDGVAAAVSELELWLLKYFAPGPFTLVLPRSAAIAHEVSAGLDTVAVRVPLHPVARRFIGAAGRPIAAPSANRSGEPSPTEFAAARTAMHGRVAAIIDGGECRYGIESTVVRVDSSSRKVLLLRPGSVTLEMLAAALAEFEAGPADRSYPRQPQSETGEVGERNDELGGRHEYRIEYRTACEAAPEPAEDDVIAVSPGTRHAHYRPNAQVYLLPSGRGDLLISGLEARRSAEANDERRGRRPQRVGVLVLNADSLASESLASGALVSVRTFTGLEEYGRELYRSFVWFDSIGCDTIVAELPRPEGLGLALRDRLLRASDGRFWSPRSG